MGSSARVTVVADAEALASALAERVAASLAAAVAARGRADVALAGGSTPRRAYELIAQRHATKLPWAAIHVWFGDERCVAPDDRESNFAAAHAALLAKVALPSAHVHRMAGERSDADAAADDYDRELPAALDLLLLGLGQDGHTASLFPGSPALAETRRRVVAVVGPKPPPRRLTITPPVIAAAREVVVAAAGADKAAAVARALAPDASPDDVPACLMAERDWLLDRAAAAELTTQAGAPSRPRDPQRQERRDDA